MIASPQLIGIAAGLVTAVLCTSLSTQTLLAILLFCLAPLPLLLAGIGWGFASAQLAFMSATVLVTLFTNMKMALLFVIAIGLPGLVLSYLAHLRRTLPAGSTPPGTLSAAPVVEWYPVGRIVMWAAILTGAIVATGVMLSGEASYMRAAKEIFSRSSTPLMQVLTGTAKDPAQVDRAAELFSRFILPASLGLTWLMILLGNVWLAAKSAAISGQLERPWPNLALLEFPPLFLVAYLVAIGIGMLHGQIGITAMAFVGAFSLAYVIMGLSILHFAVPETPLKPIILAGIYMGLLVAGGIFIPVLVLLGIGEPILQIRRRALERSTPPDNMAGPNA